MKLPRVESSYNLNSQGSNTIAPSAFTGIAEGLKGISGVANVLYEDRMRDQQEQIRANEVIAQSKFEQTLFQKKKQLTENIDTDANYTSARDKWMKESESIISTLDNAKDVDPVWKEQLLAGLRREQISTDFQLGSAIKQRRKRDVSIATNNMVDNAKTEFVYGRIDDAEYSKRIGQALGGAASNGVITADEVSGKVKDAISSGILQKTELLLQSNDVAGARRLIELNKEVMNVEDFINLNGAVAKEEYKLDAYSRVTDYITSGNTTKRPTNEQMDVAFSQNIAAAPPELYGEATISFVQATGYVPVQFKQQAATFIGNMNPNASSSDIETAIYNAKVIDQLPSGSVGSQKIETNAQLLLSRIDSGMGKAEAYKSVSMQVNDKNFDDFYNKAKTQVSRDIVKSKIDLPVDNPSATSEFIDSYSLSRASGANEDEAIKIATNTVNKSYSKFNGEYVKNSPTQVTRFKDEQSWINSAKPLIEGTGFNLPDNYDVVIAGDAQTKREKDSGKPDTEITFPVMIKTDFGSAPVFYNTGPNMGKQLRIKANPSFKEKEYRSLSDVLNNSLGSM